MAEFPAREYMQVIERYSALVADPTERLQFLLLCARVFRGDHPLLHRRGLLWKWRSRAVALESLWLTSGKAAGALGILDATLLWVYRYRRPIRNTAGVAAVCLLAAPLAGTPAARRLAWTAAPELGAATVRERPAQVAAIEPKEVWLVESPGSSELYSNGLRALNDFPARSTPRAYPVSFLGPGADRYQIEWRNRPAGIVYHTTESDVAPLEPANRTVIRQRGRNLLEYVQRNKLYNFVIDRFGRTYRVVPESESAYHAGNSIWVERGEVFINLNQSFLGVAFEARTSAGQEATEVTAAQLSSARLLTQMLRSRFGISDGNCVSHDLVSVNPEKMLIGYHTDWAGAFPYEALDLSNKYERETPAIAAFGFSYDGALVQAARGRIWPGLHLAEQRLEREAALRNLSKDRYRRQLQQDYRRRIAPLRAAARATAGARP